MIARLGLVLFVLLIGVVDPTGAQNTVERHGMTAKLKIEEIISGHLTELNGKFKLQAYEVTFEPGGTAGVHHHAGPGLRYVAAGQINFVQGGKTTVYKAGDFFFESGNIVHTAHNSSKSPTRMIFFEIVPAEWKGPSSIPPKS